MSTNSQIQTELTVGGIAKQAQALASAAPNVHALMGQLWQLYTKTYGTIAADMHDWHWQATALKNFMNAPKVAPAPAVAGKTGGPAVGKPVAASPRAVAASMHDWGKTAK